jgi:hypothetical protein
MSDQVNFKDVEKRMMHMINFEDGLWDLLLGAIFMALAIYPVTRRLLGPTWNVVLFLAVLGLGVFAQQLLRRRVAGPRIGRVRPRWTPKARLVLVVLVVMVVATLALVLMTLISPGESPSPSLNVGPDRPRTYTVEIVTMLVMAGVFSLMAYQFDVPRLYVYGWLLGFGNLASVVLEHSAGLTFNLPLAIAAGIILIIGIVLLIEFLQNYPVRQEGA